MLYVKDDFFKSLELPARNFALSLRVETGLEAQAHVVESKDGNVLLFTTDYTDGHTLKRFLAPILSVAFNDRGQDGSEINISALDASNHPYPDHDARGLVRVELNSAMIGYLTARL